MILDYSDLLICITIMVEIIEILQMDISIVPVPTFVQFQRNKQWLTLIINCLTY